MIYTLDNNIKIIILEKNSDIVSLSYFISSGFFHEKPHENNFTHLYEHILASFTSKQNCDFKEIHSQLSKSVIESNATVNSFRTQIWINGYYNQIEKLFNLLINSLFQNCLSKEQFDIEKKAVIQELLQNLNDNEYDFDFAISKFFYKNPFFDLKKGIQNMNKTTIQNIQQFFDNKLSNREIVFGCVCPLKKTKQTLKLFKKIMKNIEYSYKPHKKNITLKLPKKDKIIWIKNKNTTNDIFMKFYIPIKYNLKNFINIHIWLIYMFNINYGPMYSILRKQLKLIYSFHRNYLYDETNSRNSLLHFSTHTVNKDKVYDEILNIIRYTDLSSEFFDISKKRYIYKIKKQKNKIHFHYDLIKKNINFKDFLKSIKEINFKDFQTFFNIIKKSPIYMFYYSSIK